MVYPLGLEEVTGLEEGPVDVLSSGGHKGADLLGDEGGSGLTRERGLLSAGSTVQGLMTG